MVDRSNVKVLSFISGQEVIGEVSNKDGAYLIKRPYAIAMRPGPNGQVGLGLVPWPMLADENTVKQTGILVNFDALACWPYSPNAELLSGYMTQVTGLKILPPGTSIALTE